LPEEITEVEMPAEPIAAGKLLLACKLVSSGGEAKRMIKQSAASIDGEKLTDPNAEITPKDGAVIRVGKRKFARLKVNS
jgi:tyrosyl-tRNA synthetase